MKGEKNRLSVRHESKKERKGLELKQRSREGQTDSEMNTETIRQADGSEIQK